MWQHHEIDRSAEGSPNSWELPWPCTETLKTFVELNEQSLELLTERALLRASPASADAAGAGRPLGPTRWGRAAPGGCVPVSAHRPAGFADPVPMAVVELPRGEVPAR